MFSPPNCPHPDCARHTDPTPGFFVRKGFYRAACRAYPVQRYRCRNCHRTWSMQTFRADYRDHKPHLNAPLFTLLISGVGLRQSSRNLALSRNCTHRKFQKIACEAQAAHQHLLGQFRTDSWFQMDEFGAFEHDRHSGPLSVPVAIEAGSSFVVAAEAAPIRPSGRKSREQKARIARHEQLYGRRRDESRAATRRVLQAVAKHTASLSKVRLRTDLKAMYVPVAKSVFGLGRLAHERISGKLPRTTWNPLFVINLLDAMVRDNNGRLRRRSWLHSKLRKYLDLQLALFIAYRNYVRLRTNEDDQTPAQRAGFVDRRFTVQALLTWSQRFGERSVAVGCESWDAITVAKWQGGRLQTV